MTVEILRRGSTRHQARCAECGTVFAYDQADLQEKFVGAGGHYVPCPLCHQPVLHAGSDLNLGRGPRLSANSPLDSLAGAWATLATAIARRTERK